MLTRRPCRSRPSAVSIAALALVANASLLLSAEPIAAADSAAVALAERRAAEAFQAFTKGDYAAAVAMYLEANQAVPSGAILYNVARIYDTKLGDRQQAISFYQRYLADPDARSDLVKVATERIQDLRRVELRVAEVADQAHATRGGGEPNRPGPPGAEPDSLRTGWRTWSRLRRRGVVLGTVGLAGVAVASAFGLAAISSASVAKDLCAGHACSSQRGVDALDAAGRDATVSTIGFGAAGAVLVTGAVMYLLGENQDPPRQSSAGDIHLAAPPTGPGLSLLLSGTW